MSCHSPFEVLDARTFPGWLLALTNVTPNLYQIRLWPMQSWDIKGTLFLVYQMIVQIEISAHPWLFERNLKAVIFFAIKPMHDFLLKPCVNMASFRKIKISAFQGCKKRVNQRLFSFHVTKQNCTWYVLQNVCSMDVSFLSFLFLKNKKKKLNKRKTATHLLNN